MPVLCGNVMLYVTNTKLFEYHKMSLYFIKRYESVVKITD